jgi:hypothetical protein
MEDAGYWGLIDEAWRQVDGGAVVAALGQGGAPPVAELERRFGDLLVVLGARIAGLPLDGARAMIARHRDAIRALDRERTEDVVGAWIYGDGDGIAVVPLLGERFAGRVADDPTAAAVLAPARGLERYGGWHALARPVRERWRAALLGAIPDRFAGVAYPGDADVTSGDWATTEECRYFCGKDWRVLDRAALHRRGSDLHFVTPRGLHYLLPAFLMAALEDIDGSRTAGLPIVETLLFKLSHGYMRKTIALFSIGQREVLGDVLRLHGEHWRHGPLAEPDADLALALEQLDPGAPAPRRPKKKRR